MRTYLFRRGDGNEGNFPRYVVDLADDQCPYSALRALVANEFIAGGRMRRFVLTNIETDGESEYGLRATVYEGPEGEQAFGAAWITAELETLTDAEALHYSGRLSRYTLRDALDSAAWRQYIKGAK